MGSVAAPGSAAENGGGYATWLTVGTSFPVLTMRCNHSRVKLLTPMLLQATRRDVEQDNKLTARANFGGRTWTALPLWP
jgi:hypothetical protein